MANATELLQQGKKDALWNKYCGFLDLSLEDFMKLQEQLLLEQLDRLGRCELGKIILGGKAPKSVEEFRERAPITTYKDYAEFFSEQRGEILPEKPVIWSHTSGRSGEYQYKWAPYTQKMCDLLGQEAVTVFVLASCKRRGDVAIRQGDTAVYTAAPLPYVSGLFLRELENEFALTIFPSAEEAKGMNFQERIQLGFKRVLEEGLDFFFGITSILLRISDQMSGGTRSGKLSELLKPKVLFRLLKAVSKSKLQGRNLLPKDIWRVKGVICAGTDTSIFKDKVTKFWGKTPLEAYVCTEFGIVATQSWNYQGLTFLPHKNFWEFMLEEDYRRMRRDPGYVPKTLLLNEVKPDQEYVLVGTNFHGGGLVRYIVGDLIKIIALEDKKTGITLPQMAFSSRIDDVIDVAGFTRLTEKTIWLAIENSEIGYVDWAIRKEYEGENPTLQLYIELKDESYDTKTVENRIHECLKELNTPYRELETMAGLKPLRVKKLSKGTFVRYFEERQSAGADLAHLKPAHINPPAQIMDKLLRMSSWEI